MIHILNVVFGLIPTLILAGSIAAGVDDDRHHRRMFLLVYGLWSITLAMWNWMRSAPVWWTALWLVAGVAALGAVYAVRSRTS
ncbi:MAG: hypothetical protein M3P29_07515 [Acidobacteriota bacterium]|nr:hypothetical protein [Acidobacteriota bacterium]